jgi:hypothetical protein
MKPRFRRLCVFLAFASIAALIALLPVIAPAGAEDKDAKNGKNEKSDATSPGGAVELPKAPLLKENTRLVDVEGLVLDLVDDLKVGSVHRAVFQPRDGLGYYILLENNMLEKLLRQTAHGERPVKIRGTITVFRAQNYLLLDWAAVAGE